MNGALPIKGELRAYLSRTRNITAGATPLSTTMSSSKYRRAIRIIASLDDGASTS